MKKQLALEPAVAAAMEAMARLKEAHLELMQRFAAVEAAKHVERTERPSGPNQGDQLGSTMNESPLPRPHGGRPTVSRHVFPRRVGNVRAWAKMNGLKYTTVKRWFTEGKTLAPVPRKWAVILKHTHGIPPAAWKGGISDDIRAGRLMGPRKKKSLT
jgi:hypothetical protein